MTREISLFEVVARSKRVGGGLRMVDTIGVGLIRLTLRASQLPQWGRLWL